ncbi:MAG: metallopeptidase TldD-related protein [Candidatus Kapaibacterium sp.]|nr:metallopeptidase TldD-related protein [Candidatus Kapabacteria bacterium]
MLRKSFRLLIILLIIQCFTNAAESSEVLFSAMDKELQRTMETLSKEEKAPYFISLNVTDIEQVSITSRFGKLYNSSDNSSRILDIDLRVGDYKFDNTHIIRGNPFNFGGGSGIVNLPLEDDEVSIRNAIWFAVDKRYRSAAERLEKAVTNQAVKVAEEDSSADFSKEKPITYKGKKERININIKHWEDFTKSLSEEFNKYPWILSSSVSFTGENKAKYFTSTEGSKLEWYETGCRIYVNAVTKADDGMSLPLYKSYFSFSPEGLPEIQTIVKDIEHMVELLSELRYAPMAETFSGPAILSGEASGVFFHEIFGHRVEGHREKDPNSSQTFKKSINKKILPEFIDVVFDPTLDKLRNTELSGFYKYDDEGVQSKKVVTVEDGIFKNFLMSRSPIEGFSMSNGHGRRQAGYSAVSRQSNLIVNAQETVSKDELREMLKEEILKQNKDYGLYFEAVSGGFTFTSRTIPNAFNVTPLVVYKVYPDDRPDELVRGVDLIGTPLMTFANIVASADDMGIFNGICGAESGGVPVSACSPSLLVSTIEVQKKQKSQAKPPILASPLSEGQ